jgi:menaquinol-cytochrome c reductase iron-sulfur subunit
LKSISKQGKIIPFYSTFQEACMPKKHLSRREFTLAVTTALGGAMGLAVGLPAVAYLIDPALTTSESEGWTPLVQVDQVPVGTPTLYSFSRVKVNGRERTVTTYGVYVLVTKDNQISALSNICTHLACRVNWHEDAQEYICPCHAAVFDQDGNVLDGPPPRPMDSYPVKVDENGTLLVYYGGTPPEEENAS